MVPEVRDLLMIDIKFHNGKLVTLLMPLKCVALEKVRDGVINVANYMTKLIYM